MENTLNEPDTTPIIQKLAASILAQLRRDGRLPIRLNEEDYGDILQEGILAGITVLRKYDSRRGSFRNYLAKPIARAQLSAAWKIANCGITGDHGPLQLWSIDETADIPGWEPEIEPDVAEHVEALEHIFRTFNIKL